MDFLLDNKKNLQEWAKLSLKLDLDFTASHLDYHCACILSNGKGKFTKFGVTKLELEQAADKTAYMTSLITSYAKAAGLIHPTAVISTTTGPNWNQYTKTFIDSIPAPTKAPKQPKTACELQAEKAAKKLAEKVEHEEWIKQAESFFSSTSPLIDHYKNKL